MLPLIPIALSLAPALARWLGGNDAGAVTAQVAEVARAVVGSDDAAQVAAALEADPAKRADLQVELARIAAEHEAREHETRVEEMRIAAAGAADARARDVALRQAGAKRHMPTALVAIGVCGAAATMGAMLVGVRLGLPEGGAVVGALIAIAVGFLGIIKDAAAFEFGSSFGSRSKDAPPLPFGQGRG